MTELQVVVIPYWLNNVGRLHEEYSSLEFLIYLSVFNPIMTVSVIIQQLFYKSIFDQIISDFPKEFEEKNENQRKKKVAIL